MIFFQLFCLSFLPFLGVASATAKSTAPNGNSSNCDAISEQGESGTTKLYPGNATMGLLLKFINAQRPLSIEFLLLDLADMYTTKVNIDYLYDNIETLVTKKHSDFDALQVVCAMFQFDLLLDHILAKPISNQADTIKKILGLRKTLLEDFKERFPHYRIALEIISECPSYQIAQLKDFKAYPLLSETLSISAFLNKVTSLQGIISIDPHIAVQAYFAAISLLSSRLQIASDVDALFWIRAFFDNAFLVFRHASWILLSRHLSLEALSALSWGQIQLFPCFLEERCPFLARALQTWCGTTSAADH